MGQAEANPRKRSFTAIVGRSPQTTEEECSCISAAIECAKSSGSSSPSAERAKIAKVLRHLCSFKFEKRDVG